MINACGRPARVSAILTLLFGLILSGRPLAGGSPTPAAKPEENVQIVAQLSAQSDAWDKAIVRKDRAAIEANMAADFRQIDGQGNVVTRDAFVTELISSDLEIDPYTVEDFDVRLYGDVALLCGRTRMTGRSNGKNFTSHYRYIDIYARRDGAWKIVSVQISKIPE